MTVLAESVKQLREQTGAGMMECKKALLESSGDFQAAIEVLRKRGLSLAAKRAGRVAAEGVVGSWQSPDGKLGVLVEVNCETDFVAKNDAFGAFVHEVTELVARHEFADLNQLLDCATPTGTVRARQTELIATIGENIGIRRFSRCAARPGQQLAHYLHAGAKIGVLVRFADPGAKLSTTAARDVAMHIAAMNPQYVRQADVPATVIAKEKEIQRAQLADQQKPAAIFEKIIAGKLQKYFSEVCLEDQLFVRDPEGKLTVAKALLVIDPALQVDRFVRFQVGEGVEK